MFNKLSNLYDQLVAYMRDCSLDKRFDLLDPEHRRKYFTMSTYRQRLVRETLTDYDRQPPESLREVIKARECIQAYIDKHAYYNHGIFSDKSTFEDYAPYGPREHIVYADKT